MTDFQLGSRAVEANYRAVGFDQVGSTSSEAANALRAGDTGPIWFAAFQQTEGRGRRGRTWESPHGNLAASLLLSFDVEPVSLAGLGFVAGIALGDALREAFPNGEAQLGADGGVDDNAFDLSEKRPARIALKWPNDVLANGAKLSGILLEAHALPNGRQAVIIGIGVNVVKAPDDVPYPTTSLNELGSPFLAQDLFKALSDKWVAAFEMWNYGHGLADVLDIWRENATGFGSKIAVNTPQGIIRGVFQDIDDEGRLLIRGDDGQSSTISAGDVHFGATASVKD